MFRHARIAASISLLTATLATIPLVAAPNPSGTAEKVSQSANASGAAGARVLEVEGAVFKGDEIRTDRAGEAQIRLADDTRIVVGPSARLTIDNFVFNGNTAERVTLSAVRGAFRFITGKSRKLAYVLRTPVMTIGVRGTGLDGYVEPGTGRTTIAIYEGAAQLCDVTGQCIEVGETCGVTVIPGGGFGEPTPGSRAVLFPYGGSQASLLPDFRLDVSGCRTASAPPRESGSLRGGGGGTGGGGNGGGGGDPGSND
jgi:ferric-dicitrate binding protein FerR (iron transport regulator)